MNQALVPTQLDGVATMAWSWTVEFTPRLISAALLLVVGLFLAGWVRNGLERITRGNSRIDATIRPVMLATVRYGLLVLVLILVLSQLGIETTSLLAVLGAAGLAIGLALQGTLSNIAAGIMLLWLRPYVVGAFIEVNGMSGVVEETGPFFLRAQDVRWREAFRSQFDDLEFRAEEP